MGFNLDKILEDFEPNCKEVKENFKRIKKEKKYPNYSLSKEIDEFLRV